MRGVPQRTLALRGAAATITAVPPHGHTVLIVDDDVDLLGAFSLALTMSGVGVHAATSGLEALDLVVAGLRPCLILLDIRMPHLDGWAVWEQMRLLPGMAETPVILVSGEPPDYARAARAGVRAYLRKPVTQELMLEAVARHCAAAAA
jgi:CheY-like chemotaxis protein